VKARKQQKPSRVTQHDLAEIERLRAFKAQLSVELTTIGALLETRETQVMQRLTGGARVQAGELVATLGEKTVCNPKYKDELVAHFEQSHGISGKLVEEQVKARWTKKKSTLDIVHQVRLGVVRS
jgi:hypothetical protein